jgi:hypothetical protein
MNRIRLKCRCGSELEADIENGSFDFGAWLEQHERCPPALTREHSPLPPASTVLPPCNHDWTGFNLTAGPYCGKCGQRPIDQSPPFTFTVAGSPPEERPA